MRSLSQTLTFTPAQGSVSAVDVKNAERILAHRAVYIHGKSRAQVLESGGRVNNGVTMKRGVSVGTGDSGRKSRTTPAVFLRQIAGDLS